MSDMTRRSAVLEAPPRSLADADGQMPRIIEELDGIVGRSRRGSGLRRALRRIGRRFAEWLDRLVPPPAAVTDDLDPPPQIRFPFF